MDTDLSLETRLVLEHFRWLNQGDKAVYFDSIQRQAKYLNLLYRDLNDSETFAALDSTTLVNAYALAVQLAHHVDSASFKLLH